MNRHIPTPTIDELLDRAVRAINRGDRATADALAGQVLAVDHGNPEVEELLAAPSDGGEIRRLTMLFADLVDSTALSTRTEPETYRTVVGRYRAEVLRVVDRYEGHVGSTKGDGLLAIFGHPTPHEDDVRRAVRAGLEITHEVATLSERVRRRFGFDIDVRVGIHRGVVYLDTAQDDVYGLGANLAARMCSLAEPGTVAVSEAVERLVGVGFQLHTQEPAAVKGVEGLIVHYRAIAELDPARTALGPLVGRQREFAYLDSAWAQAVSGRLTTPGVVFEGEGGIGKSRLAAAAVELAERSGAVVLELFGSPFDTDTGLGPVRNLLERRCGIGSTSDPADRLAKLKAEIDGRGLDPVTMVPLLAPVLAITPEAGYQPAPVEGHKLHGQIATAVYDYLLACLGDGPALLVVEDLHWFDPDTVETVHKLLQADTGRLLVVVTAREPVSLPGEVHTFTLQPLTDQQADEMVLALDPAMTSDARNEVLRRCDGMPLYIEEVVAKIKEQQANSAPTTQVPDTLYEALVARLPFGRSAVLVAEAAAIIGSVVERDLLQSAVELGRREVDRLIGELTGRRVLEPVGNQKWRFRHELLREVAAELLPPSVRSRLHGRVGDALAAASASGNPEWWLVAHHYEQAERFDEARSACLQASAVARRRGALSEARIYLTRALQNIERSEPSPARDDSEIAVRLQRGFLSSVAMGHASSEAAADFERCLHLIGDNVSPRLYATLTALWSYYTARGDLQRTTRLTETLKVGLRTGKGNRRLIQGVAGMLAWLTGEFDSARKQLEAAAPGDDLSAPTIEKVWFAPNEPFASVYTYVGLARFVEGDLVGAEEALAQSERRCQQVAFPHGAFSLSYLRSLETWIRIEAGQLDLAADRAKDVAQLAQKYGFDEWALVAATQHATVRALVALAADEVDPADLQHHIETMTGFVQVWRAIELKIYLMCYDAVLARLLIAAGDQDAARDRVDCALQLADETRLHFYDAELLRVRAHTFDDSDVRHAGLCEAVALARSQGALIFELRAAADDFELIGGSARTHLAEAVQRFPSEQSWPELARARALLG